MLIDMMENKGAVFYVCGDAQAMQRSVLETWQLIYQEEGKKTAEDSIAFLKKLQSEERYIVDIWG